MRRALKDFCDFTGFVIAPSLFVLSLICFVGIWLCYLNQYDWFERGESALAMTMLLAFCGSLIWLAGWIALAIGRQRIQFCCFLAAISLLTALSVFILRLAF